MVEVKPIGVSCSSQDPAFPASNLVRGASKPSDERKQWLCSSPDEKFAHVILTYEKPFVISSLEIKNNGSAYVQVEGGNTNEDSCRFKVLWRMQTLMTPNESRMGTETDGIFIFLPQDLATSEVDKMWDMLKITCSQPFNKSEQYGLSHVVARSALPVKEESPSSPSNCGITLPNLKWEHDAAAEEINNMQAHRHQGNTVNHQTHMSSEVSSSECSDASTTSISPMKQKHSSHPENFYSAPGRSAEPSSSSFHDIGQSSDQQLEQKSPAIKRESSLNITSDLSHNNDVVVGDVPMTPTVSSLSGNSSSNVPLKRRMSGSDSDSDSDSDDVQIIKRPAPTNIVYKPFSKLLEGVQIVISGFQNPFRAEIRSRALQLGATYSPLWSENSTHLICAFLYTPKYRQAAGEGLIVSRDWIDQCFLQRKRLPWKRFALNPSERCEISGETEIWELLQSQASSSSFQNNSGPTSSPSSSTERYMSNPPVQVICSNQPMQTVVQNRSPSSNIISAAEVKREAPDSFECSSSSRSSQQQTANFESGSRQLTMQNNGSPLSQGITVKREINNEESHGIWDNVQTSPATASTSGTDQTPRSQSSNSTSQILFSTSSALDTVPCNARIAHETLRSPAASSTAQMEPGRDGYAGYYRPISQPCSVPHSSQSAAYLVPPVIMLPQTLPQYFVPVSQQFQVPSSSRDTYMGRTSQVQGQHIRVIHPPTKSANDAENSEET